MSGAEGAQFQPEPPHSPSISLDPFRLCEGSPKPAKSKAVTVLGQHRGHDPGFAESA